MGKYNLMSFLRKHTSQEALDMSFWCSLLIHLDDCIIKSFFRIELAFCVLVSVKVSV